MNGRSVQLAFSQAPQVVRATNGADKILKERTRDGGTFQFLRQRNALQFTKGPHNIVLAPSALVGFLFVLVLLLIEQ